MFCLTCSRAIIETIHIDIINRDFGSWSGHPRVVCLHESDVIRLQLLALDANAVVLGVPGEERRGGYSGSHGYRKCREFDSRTGQNIDGIHVEGPIKGADD